MSSEPLLVEELDAASDEDRMNIFRRYFARSRYNRLIIQQTLVKTIAQPDLLTRLHVMEKAHDDELTRVTAFIKSTKYVSQFLKAAQEEDDALAKVLEAYENRMKSTGEIKNKTM